MKTGDSENNRQQFDGSEKPLSDFLLIERINQCPKLASLKSINETLSELTDLDGYKQEFLNLFGFEIDGVDYDADVNPDVPILQMV